MIRTTTFFVKLVTVLFCLTAHVTHSQVVTTIASGTNIGDGQSALNAGLGGPTGVAFDQSGNTYIVDTDGIRVRKINSNGIITTIAGNGRFDAGLGLLALGVAVDATGKVYIANSNRHSIQRLDPNGVMTTIAGTGSQGFSGDGGLAIDARLSSPTNLTFDTDGNLYIVDSSNSRIRKISTSGIITTVAGNGGYDFAGDGGPALNASFKNPSAIAVDGAGNLYIADSYNMRVRKVNTNGIITTIAGTGSWDQQGSDGGLAIYTPVFRPVDLAVDAIGNVYISQANGRIRKIALNGIISSVTGNGMNGFSGDGGPAANAQIGLEPGVDLDGAGNIYISDRGNGRVRRITNDGIINTIAGGFSGDGGLAINANFRQLLYSRGPSNLTIDKQGNVYVSDRVGDRIRKINSAGIISSIAGNGGKGYTGDGGPATQAQLRHPRGIGFDSTGNLYIVDQYNTRLRRIDVNGVITTIAGNGGNNFIENESYVGIAEMYNPNGMAVSKNGTVFVPISTCILKITPAGIISIVAGKSGSVGYSGDGGLATNAEISNPSSVSLDKDENLYIADFGNNRIRKVDANGIITTVAGNGSSNYSGENVQAINSSLVYPYEVAFDYTGAMYVTESSWNRVRKVNRNGIMRTVEIPRELGRLNGLKIDPVGNLYIADTDNQHIVKVTYPIRPILTINKPVNCLATSLTITAQPSGEGFVYQFGPGATQIGNTNQAIVTTPGTYSVTVSTSVFGSPAGSTTLSIMAGYAYTVKNGNWNDPTIWSCGAVPDATQNVQLLHEVNLPQNYQTQVQRISYGSGGDLNVGTGAKLNLTPAP